MDDVHTVPFPVDAPGQSETDGANGHGTNGHGANGHGANGHGANGHGGRGGDGGGRPVRGGRRTPSTKPALIVVGIAAFLVILFGIGGALDGGTGAPSAPVSVHGTSLASAPAAKALTPIEKPGTPPGDILGALVVPAGSTRRSSSPWDGETQFSGSASFSVAATQAAVVKFFQVELKARGWDVLSTAGAHDQPTSTVVLAQKASNDGWYWEVGATVRPTTFTDGGRTDTTSYVVKLFEVQDAD